MKNYWLLPLAALLGGTAFASPATERKDVDVSRPAPRHSQQPSKKNIPHYSDFDLSDEATAAFLNDPEVIKAYENADFFDENSKFFKDAVRLLERKAYHYKVTHPKQPRASASARSV